MSQRVVLESCEFEEFKSRGASPSRNFSRSDQAFIFVSAFGDEAGHVFSADDGKQKGSPVTIDRGEKQHAARPHERRQRFDDRARIGDVLEHFHAGDDIEGRWLLLC